MIRTVVWAAWLASAPAMAAPASCPTDGQSRVFASFRERLAGADSVDDARDLALRKVRLGQRAVSVAARLRPADTAGIADATQRLHLLEAEVLAADSPGAVAAPFEQMANFGGSCDYTDMEIVIIVIGFILGILPGILFLFLFC